jgi:predicted dehydrogenase
MSKLSIAIIGCGAATTSYYVPASKKCARQIDELFLVDPHSGRAQETQAAIGYGEVVSDYHDILDKVNGAVIVLPNKLHYPVAMDFLRKSVHVLCEKPLAENTAEARELIEVAEEQKVGLCLNNTRRMFPNFSKTREIVKNGQIGKILSISYIEGLTFGWPSATGFYVDPSVSSRGILNDVGPHILDQICWWLGGKPTLKSYQDDSYGGPESVCEIVAEYHSCRINIFLNRLNDLKTTFVIEGEKGSLKGELFQWHKLELTDNNGQTSTIKLKVPYKTYPAHVLPIFENFLKVIQSETEPLVNGTEVLPSIEWIEECYQNRKRIQMTWNENLEKILEN